MSNRPSIPGVRVFPRGKKFAFRLELPADRLTGDRRRHYRGGFDSEEEAWTAAIRAKAEHAEGRKVHQANRTIAGFMAEWLAAIEHEVKPSTIANYSDYTNAYVLPNIGPWRLKEIEVPDLNAYYRRLLDSGRVKVDTNSKMYAYWKPRADKDREPTPSQIARACGVSIHAARAAVLRYRKGRTPAVRSPGLAPKTVKNVHRMLHRALTDAVSWGYLAQNPAQHASLPRTGRGKKIPNTPWSTKELAQWLECATEDRDAGMWVLAATTGMRRSELAGLQRMHVDVAQRALTIEPTRVVVSGKAQASDGKTESSRRVISLDPFTLDALLRHLAKLDQEAAAFGRPVSPADFLLCNPDGTPVHPDTITRRFNKLVDRAKVPRIRLHDVRHTYATLSLDQGIDPKVVSDRLGHANMAITLSIYTHRTTGKDRSAAESFAVNLFQRAPDPPAQEVTDHPMATDPATDPDQN